MLTDLLPYLSPETIMSIMVDIETASDAFDDPNAISRFWPLLKDQLAALVGANEVDALLVENAINPYPNK